MKGQTQRWSTHVAQCQTLICRIALMRHQPPWAMPYGPEGLPARVPPTGASVVEPYAAVVIGAVAAAVNMGSSYFFTWVLSIDDPLHAAAIHLAPGAWGLFAAGLFAEPVGGSAQPPWQGLEGAAPAAGAHAHVSCA
jgi:hypothetical protein